MPEESRDDARPRSREAKTRGEIESQRTFDDAHAQRVVRVCTTVCSGDSTRPISRQILGARSRIALASASSASKRTNVSSVRRCLHHQRARCMVYVPHLPVRRPAYSLPWSNVIDRVLESSARQFRRAGAAGSTVFGKVESSVLNITIQCWVTSGTSVNHHPLPRAIRRIFLPLPDFAS